MTQYFSAVMPKNQSGIRVGILQTISKKHIKTVFYLCSLHFKWGFYTLGTFLESGLLFIPSAFPLQVLEHDISYYEYVTLSTPLLNF